MLLECRNGLLLSGGFCRDDRDIFVHGRRVGIVRLMDGCDACLDAAKAVVIDVKGVVALVISMVARCARSRALEEVVGLCEVRLQF